MQKLIVVLFFFIKVYISLVFVPGEMNQNLIAVFVYLLELIRNVVPESFLLLQTFKLCFCCLFEFYKNIEKTVLYISPN